MMTALHILFMLGRRAGPDLNSMLTVRRMNAAGTQILEDSITVFDGRKSQPTIEGPKFYKRNGYYYIFAPAGGVADGWQVVLRSKNVFGPYEDRIVLDRGKTTINGPHQGGWVETQNGESWFIHFQDRGAYGRIVHLQPMAWNNDWPVIGADPEGDGKGEPVLKWKKPDIGKTYPVAVPQTSDEFDSTVLGFQWQWHANNSDQWYSLATKKGSLRLQAVAMPAHSANLWDVPNLLLQKFPGPQFTATTRMSINAEPEGEKAGLVVLGIDYAFVAAVKKNDGYHIVKAVCKNADTRAEEKEETDLPLLTNTVYMRVVVDAKSKCMFSYSENGKVFKLLGQEFQAREGRWIGAKIGIFSLCPAGSKSGGFSDFDWFRIE